jgi:hypothetical protein
VNLAPGMGVFCQSDVPEAWCHNHQADKLRKLLRIFLNESDLLSELSRKVTKGGGGGGGGP